MSGAGWARQLAGVDPNTVTSREALAHLPVLRADDWPALRGETIRRSAASHCRARAHAARADVAGAGLSSRLERQRLGRRGAGAVRGRHAAQDVVLNCFSYHLTPTAS